MNEEILKLAKELGFTIAETAYPYEVMPIASSKQLEDFHKAAYNAGLEAAAKVCEKTRDGLNQYLATGISAEESYLLEWDKEASHGEEYAEEIRALEKK